MDWSWTFRKPISIFGRNYLSFINEGTTLNNGPLTASLTVCIESCGTGDISSSIITMHAYACPNNENIIHRKLKVTTGAHKSLMCMKIAIKQVIQVVKCLKKVVIIM